MSVENRLKYFKLADKYLKQGKKDYAILEYSKALEIKPDDLEARRIIGDLQLSLNKNNEAIKQFEWIADFYTREGFLTKAIAMLRRVNRIDPENERISYKLADLYSKQGLILEAKQIFLEMIEVYKKNNDNKKALAIYKKILEFDKNNVKMHLLLAENYFKEGMIEDAVNGYLTAADVLMRKKEFPQAEELLSEVQKKINHERIAEKMVSCFVARGDDDQAIETLRSMGEKIFANRGLMKLLGELYLKKEMVEEAERIFLRITRSDASEIEILMKIGRIYLQREEFERAYQLFAPAVDNLMNQEKYDDAASLLRFIIASNHNYLPALHKLGEIFRITGKTSSLIALYESLIPVYEQREMRDELIDLLKELISLSDSPFTYQYQLEKILNEGQDEKGKEREFIDFHLRNIDEALQVNDFEKAVELLKTAKGAFPDNLEIREKLFDVYQLKNDLPALMDEGIELLQILRDNGQENKFNELLSNLNKLDPNDNRLLELSGHSGTMIDIEFDQDMIKEQMEEIDPGAEIKELQLDSEIQENQELLVLTGEENLADRQSGKPDESRRGLSSQLVELDFYISDGYFDDAGHLLEKLRQSYPESREVASRIARLQELRASQVEQKQAEKVQSQVEPEMEINFSISDESSNVQEAEDSKVNLTFDPRSIEMPDFSSAESGFEIELKPLEIEMERDLEPLVPEMPIAPPEKAREPVTEWKPEQSGASDYFNIDDILESRESSQSMDSPFSDMDEQGLFFEENELLDNGQEIFQAENAFLETEKNVPGELAAIAQSMDELELQRTSTIEKNMMEIFREFKRGVDEKIGHEDFDTRYNLGIAYKEMGLIEEAIHEFLISAKHPLKLFDSAGLLGICFREKGMLEESLNWLERALEVPDRKPEERLAVKYEIVLSAMMKEELELAMTMAGEIMEINPNYRDISTLNEEINSK